MCFKLDKLKMGKLNCHSVIPIKMLKNKDRVCRQGGGEQLAMVG